MRFHLLFCVLLSGLLLIYLFGPSATAAGITLTAGQQDYYFLTGQPVQIPLAATSSFPGAMPGTVRFSTDAELQKTGAVMISTENRVFTYTLPAGPSFVNLTMAPSPVSRDYRVHVSYYYSDPSPVNVSLPEFSIYIVADPGLINNSPESLESTSLPESGQIPVTSSVSVVQQDVGVREQIGSDSIGTQSASGVQQQPATGTGGHQGMSQQEQEEDAFDTLLARDPLVAAVNSSLVSEGFTCQTLNTQPAGIDTGTFSMLYRRGAEDQAIVQGTVQEGAVPSVIERANAEITADPVLDTNATFESFTRTLAGQEYGYREVTVNRTLTGAMANISYTTPEGEKAWVNATTGDNRVIRVSMERAEGLWSSVLIPALTAGAFIVISGWYVRRRYKRRGRAAPVIKAAGPPPPVFDHRREAEHLISDAELAYSRCRYTDAYSLAGRALRVFLSHEYGNHGEVTAQEIISLMRGSGSDTTDIDAVLGQCNDVIFAKERADAGEFSSLVSRIRRIIR